MDEIDKKRISKRGESFVIMQIGDQDGKNKKLIFTKLYSKVDFI